MKMKGSTVFTDTELREAIGTVGGSVSYDVPTLTGLQAQGDLLVIPVPDAARNKFVDGETWSDLEAKGIVLLTGEEGHDHLLRGTPGVQYVHYPERQTIASLTVPEGGLAVLGHDTHGDACIGAGVYVIRRQREMADQIRMVAD